MVLGWVILLSVQYQMSRTAIFFGKQNTSLQTEKSDGKLMWKGKVHFLCEKCYFFAKNGFETEFEKKEIRHMYFIVIKSKKREIWNDCDIDIKVL